MECGEIRSFCYGRCLLIMINTKKNRKEHKKHVNTDFRFA
jgi:hypothetical protein